MIPLLQKIRLQKKPVRSSLERLALNTVTYLKQQHDFAGICIQEQFTIQEFAERMLRVLQESPSPFTHFDFCSGLDVCNTEKWSYQRTLAQQFPESAVYCIDIDFSENYTDSIFFNLHYRYKDLGSGLSSDETIEDLISTTYPLSFSGMNLPVEIARKVIPWTVKYRALFFAGSIAGVEFLEEPWTPSSQFLKETLTAEQKKRVQSTISLMQKLVSPFRHDYSRMVNNLITAGKQIITLDQAIHLAENEYSVELGRRQQNDGPRNWSRGEIFIYAQRKHPL